jgi:hypothetical protein
MSVQPTTPASAPVTHRTCCRCCANVFLPFTIILSMQRTATITHDCCRKGKFQSTGSWGSTSIGHGSTCAIIKDTATVSTLIRKGQVVNASETFTSPKRPQPRIYGHFGISKVNLLVSLPAPCTRATTVSQYSEEALDYTVADKERILYSVVHLHNIHFRQATPPSTWKQIKLPFDVGGAYVSR